MMWPSEGIVYHVLAALALLVAGTQQVTSAQDRTFQPVTVIRRPFPAIKDAKFVSAEEGDNELLPEELVLGVVLLGFPTSELVQVLPPSVLGQGIWCGSFYICWLVPRHLSESTLAVAL